MDPERDYRVIAIDFDNTLFITEYPRIIAPISSIIERAKKHKEGGDKLILWTCREGPDLDAAIQACREEGLEFDAVNDNLTELKEFWGNNPRKVGADEYWDDKNLSALALIWDWEIRKRLEFPRGEYGREENSHDFSAHGRSDRL